MAMLDTIKKGMDELDARDAKKKKKKPVPEKEGGFTGGKPWPIKDGEGV